jgi:Fe-S cluster biogenesis protein NfuA
VSVESGVAAAPEPTAVQSALDGVRPRIHAHHGDVAIKEITPEGVVRLSFKGNCIGCPYQLSTFGAALLPPLESVPGVTGVELEGRIVPLRTLKRIARLYAPRQSMPISPRDQENTA